MKILLVDRHPQFWLLLIWAGIALLMSGASTQKMMNGFDLTSHSIPLEEIVSGGPPRDGIPALTDPDFIKGGQASYLKDEDRVLGIAIGQEAKAYPIKILNWHEIVNDWVGGRPVVITYCPLCATGMVFDPVVNGKRLIFGVSGLLYNSDVLMYDRQTESLWSQIGQEAVTGQLIGTKLTLLPLLHTTWGEWRTEHPKTLVLSADTGYFRDYSRDPYSGYAETPRLFFSVKNQSRLYPPKEWVLGIVVKGKPKAYAFSELAKQPGVFTNTVGGETLMIHYSDTSKTAFITHLDGTPIPSVVGFWFAWYAFYPNTTVYKAEAVPER